MKKLNKKQKKRCARRAAEVMRMRAIEGARRRRSRRVRRAKSKIAKSFARSFLVPQNVCYYGGKEQRKAFAFFLAKVDDSLAKGENVVLDFHQTERLYPCGVLILMGMVDHWVQCYPNRLSATYPADDLVEQMLQHVGVLQKLLLEPRRNISHTDVTRWHYFTGMNVDATAIEPFMEKVRDLVGEKAQMGLADCVNEAMTNVRHHAYSGGAGGCWWIFATISDKRVYVAMHDRGDSIPGTLLAKPEVSDFFTARIWRRGGADGKLIAAAAAGRTSTKLPYRGQGLPEMLQFSKGSQNGELAIFSRNGFFRYSGREKIESIGRLAKPITGTLIVWMINLSGTTQ